MMISVTHATIGLPPMVWRIIFIFMLAACGLPSAKALAQTIDIYSSSDSTATFTPSNSTAPESITDDPDLRNQLAGDPKVVIPTGSSIEVPSPYSKYLIGSGVLLLAIVGIIQLRGYLRKKRV